MEKVDPDTHMPRAQYSIVVTPNPPVAPRPVLRVAMAHISKQAVTPKLLKR